MTTMMRLLLSTAAAVLLLLPSCSYCLSSSRTAASRSKSSPFSLAAVSSSQVAALDGAEWTSLQLHLMGSDLMPRGILTKVARMKIITGTMEESKERVVGIQANANSDDTIALDATTNIYKDSMATIPPRISNEHAISTLLGSLVGVHCALPQIEQVGGSNDERFVSGKVVIVGGSDYACFAAEALAACGANVVQVSTGTPSTKKHPNIEIMSPAVAELDLGFADVVGEFDVLLDCMSDEAKLSGMRIQESDNLEQLSTSGVVAELRKQHKCSRYVSTMSQSQRIIWNDGVLWGPKKASSHVNELTSKTTPQTIVPPRHFASTLQTLLDNNITWTQKKEGNNVLVRGWSLKDFWELSSWPRDSAGTGETRYGLPVVDVDAMLEERFSKARMVAEPPSVKSAGKFQEEEQQALQEQRKADEENPHVMSVRGVDGLQRDIIAAEKDCLLFLSAPWCRTCRYLNPGYTRMARETSVQVTFAKADASGNIGKALGKALEVDAVPAFVLFRQGEVFGSPLSVSRLPSRKLEQAVDCLASGMEWDDCLLDEEDE